MNFLMVAGLADSLITFREPLLVALQAKGLQVHVAAPNLRIGDAVRNRLEGLNFIVHNVPMRRTGTNPLTDLSTLWALWCLMRRVKPHFVLGYTVKPVVYGSLAARFAGVPNRYALITGLGYAFQGEGRRAHLQALVQWLYKLALSNVKLVFFQNPDDQILFSKRGILAGDAFSHVLNGSGVDLVSFAAATIPNRPLSFLMIARLLGDKGVREYAEAAQRIRAKHPEIKFVLVGWIDSNPDAISEAQLGAWVADGGIEYVGRLIDVRPAIAACSIYVLPSYREGTPRTVLEAMAMGRAIITTDAPGCRETVVDGENGFLVQVRSVDSLEHAMLKFIDNPALVHRMGLRSRQIAVEKYDVHKVNAVMLKEMGIA